VAANGLERQHEHEETRRRSVFLTLETVMSMPATPTAYPARLDVDYVDEHNRTTTFFRVFTVIPIAIVYGALTAGATRTVTHESGQTVTTTSGGIASGLFVATVLMVLYPSTVDEQAVHLDLDYPDAQRDLNRWLPLVKWLMAIPHFIVLFFLLVGAFFAVVIAWFAILFTGHYPRALFDYVVGVGRWTLRVEAYAFLLITDRYPPFSLA
jgi:Domain of unknown function (DUF4389)